ncbi:MAG: hypothetical protein O3B47_03410 [bacterium]|nr:hypothetical protein [bacterium]
MRNKILVLLTLLMFFSQSTYAEMLLFVSDSCTHCKNLEEELRAKDYFEQLTILRFEISKDDDNRLFYLKNAEELNYTGGQVPLLIDEGKYYEGSSQILQYLEQFIPKDTDTDLTPEDSIQLNEMLKASTLIDESSQDPPPKTSNKTKIIGLIAILFGLTIFGTIIWRARKKR